MADKEANTEMVVTIRVQGINFLTQEGYTVVRMHTSTDIENSASQKKIESTLYTYRNLSAQVFEPFVYIGRTGERQEVLAYSDEREFLALEVNGEDSVVLREVKEMAAKKEMRLLARFVDLIEQAINTTIF